MLFKNRSPKISFKTDNTIGKLLARYKSVKQNKFNKCGVYQLTQTAEQMLNTFERKILRRIYGQHKKGGRWRPRWNSELYSLYKEPNIVEDIKIRRLRWADHIVRKEEERIPKKVLNGNFYTTRPVGKPRTRWADVVQRDALQLLGIRGLRRRAENRDEWRRLMREAKARKGL